MAFREEPQSYRRTGIPSGDPRRYQARGIMKMSTDKLPPGHRGSEEGQLEEIETEGDRQLKQLLKKQLNTDIALEDHISPRKRKVFTESTVHVPITAAMAGSKSLEQYRKISKKEEEIEDLKHCGLTSEEIDLKLLHHSGREPKVKRFGENPAATKMKFDEIEKKIQKRNEDLSHDTKFGGVKVMSRHEMELEKSLSSNQEKANVLKCLMTERTGNFTEMDAFFSNGNDEEDEAFSVSTCMGKPKHWCSKCSSKHYENMPCRIIESVCTKCGKPEVLISDIKEKIDDDICTCNMPYPLGKWTSVKERQSQGKHVKLKCESQGKNNLEILTNTDTTPENIPEDVIRKYKLNAEEIKSIPRFKNYEPGVPSKTLFLKNLASQMTESDLKSLFDRYQEDNSPPLEYTLMTGKMKGQAFVTFQNEETATNALDLVHGYGLKGKPIIIQYGRKS